MKETKYKEMKSEFTRTLAKISSTLAALCLAILIFSLNTARMDPLISQVLWWAVILFAAASFRCLDVLMDEISDMQGTRYRVWPRKGNRSLFDRRIFDFEGAILIIFMAWILFSLAMFLIGNQIGMPPRLNVMGVGLMILFALLFMTREPDIQDMRKLFNRMKRIRLLKRRLRS